MIEEVTWSVECGQWPTLDRQREAARSLLCKLMNIERVSLCHDARGVPFFSSRPELKISISHCHHAVAVAYSLRYQVGIDVESRRRVSEGLMKRVSTSEEMARVSASNDPVIAFLQLWTRKEAVLKCRGTGIKGFESMQSALMSTDCRVYDLPCGSAEVVAALAISEPQAVASLPT